jgi:UDP-N-acetylglucosamine--N-acetylmuramyl-(pentapeptide) pyrophosphoryl-undecaprenol N-acetylglucosamine transferase
MERYFPAEKIVMTGNPVRQDVIDISGKKDEAAKYFQLDVRKKTVLILGGSLGARSINTAIKNGLRKFSGSDVQLVWQTGKAFFATAQEAVKGLGEKGIVSRDFITRMDYAYSCADVVVSRAGASSVSELALVGKPSVLVPSPNVAEDHQTKNAMALVNREAALLVHDSEAQEKLAETAIALVNDSAKQKILSGNISSMALRNSAGKIVEEIYNIIGR